MFCFADVEENLSSLWGFFWVREVRSVEEGRLEGALPFVVMVTVRYRRWECGTVMGFLAWKMDVLDRN